MPALVKFTRTAGFAFFVASTVATEYQCSVGDVACKGLSGSKESLLVQSGQPKVTQVGGHSDGPVLPGADLFESLDDEFDIKSAPRNGQALRGLFGSQSMYLTIIVDLAVFLLVARAFHVWRQAPDAKDATDDEQAPQRELSSTLPAKNVDMNALSQAIVDGDEEQCKSLLQGSRAIVNKEDAWDCTVLHTAANVASPSITRMLLELGADANAKEAWDETPLHFAGRAGSVEVCQLLVNHGADLNAVNADDRTPLFVAAKAGKEEVCKYLLDKGAVVGASDADVPPLLSMLLTCRIFEDVARAKEACESCCSEDE